MNACASSLFVNPSTGADRRGLRVQCGHHDTTVQMQPSVPRLDSSIYFCAAPVVIIAASGETTGWHSRLANLPIVAGESQSVSALDEFQPGLNRFSTQI